MIVKAYGSTCTLNQDSITIQASNKLAMKAIGAETRTIPYKDIMFLELKKGNMCVNHTLTIGDKLGKTVIYMVPWKNSYDTIEMLYNSLYVAVNPMGNLTQDKPKTWRKDI